MNETLMDRILERDNLKEAWRRVKSNGGAPGVDGMPLEKFPGFVKEHWPQVRERIKPRFCIRPRDSTKNAGHFLP